MSLASSRRHGFAERRKKRCVPSGYWPKFLRKGDRDYGKMAFHSMEVSLGVWAQLRSGTKLDFFFCKSGKLYHVIGSRARSEN